MTRDRVRTQAVPAILLAAGASTRMGSVKALLPLEHGAPAVCQLADIYERVCGECLVVTGYHGDAVEQALAQCGGSRAVRNPHPERGQISSLQCGITVLSQSATPAPWFLFAPVDCFDVSEALLQTMMDAMLTASPETLVCIPASGEKHGHPVALRWRLAEDFLSLDEGETARTVIHRYRKNTVFVPIADADLLTDYDTPDSYRRRMLRAERDT